MLRKKHTPIHWEDVELFDVIEGVSFFIFNKVTILNSLFYTLYVFLNYFRQEKVSC